MVSVPAATGGINKTAFSVLSSNRGNGAVCIRGKDYLGLITIPVAGTSPAGTTVFNMPISPSAPQLQSSRLSRFSQMYDKFFFKRLKFHFTAQTPTTTQGSIIVAYDHDAADATPPVSESGIQALMSFQDSVTAPAWASVDLDCHVRNDAQDWYYTNFVDEEERIAFQGQLYVTVLTGYSVGSFLSAWVEYEVDFWDPQLDPSSNTETKSFLAGAVVSNTANAAFNPLAGVWGTSANNPLNPFIQPGVDSAGNSYLNILKGGAYLLEQIAKQSSAGTFTTFNTPTVSVNHPGQTATITNNESLAAIGAGTSAYRKDLLKIPFGGAKVYGTAAGADTVGTLIVRVFPAISSIFT